MKICELQQQTAFYSLDKLKEFIAKNESTISRYAYILHDGEVNEEGEPKAQHFHCMIEFNSDSWKKEQIAQKFEIDENFVRYAKTKGKNAYLFMCKYLVHMNDKKKTQYDVNDVVSNFDYTTFVYEPTKEEIELEQQEKNEEFINDCIELINNKKSYRAMAVKYGRDFMKNWKSYKEFAEIVAFEETEESEIY